MSDLGRMLRRMANDSDKGWLGRAFAGGAVRAIGYYLFLWCLPIATPIVTGVAGYLNGSIPWMWIITASVVAFAGISAGLLRFDEWRDRRRIEGKLSITGALVGRSIRGDGVIIGISLASSAGFPVEFEVEEIRTRIGNTVPILPHKKTRITLSAKGFGWHYDNSIAVAQPPRPGTLEGFVEFVVKYGVGVSLAYRLTGKKQVVMEFNADGLLTNAAWHEAN